MSEKQRILVIDDDVQLVDTVQTLLEGTGYSVSYAHHAEKGMELAREVKPDLILLDIMFAGPPGRGLYASRCLFREAVQAGRVAGGHREGARAARVAEPLGTCPKTPT